MTKITKMVAAACVAMLFGGSLMAQDAAKPVPGAVLSVYSLTDTDRPLPEAEPLAVIVDDSDGFAKKNLKIDDATAKFFRQEIFMVWKGYVSVPAKGYYTFAISYCQNSGYVDRTILQLNGQDFLGIEKIKKGGKPNDSKSLLLDQGDYEITIIHNGNHQGDFVLNMWNKATPLQKVNVTPSSMIHAEQ